MLYMVTWIPSIYPLHVSIYTPAPWILWDIHITIWLFNIAMENCPFIDGLPIKNGDFPWLC
jgi:hypothetical protein